MCIVLMVCVCGQDTMWMKMNCNDWREKVVYTKKCEYCGQEFKTHAEHAKYCCKYHGGKARRMRYLKKKKLIGTWEKQLKKKSRGI